MNSIKSKKIISLMLMLSILAPSLYFNKPQKTEAVVDNWFYEAAGWVEGAASSIANSATAGATQSMWSKEFFQDGILYSMTRMAIQRMVASTVNWINNGFEGNPAFVTDLGGFLEETADIVVGKWIFGSNLKGLCDPFSLDVKLALMQDFTREYEPKCTLSEVTDNINGAIDDLGRQWDWNTWNSITQNSNNNAYGTYISVSKAINDDLAKKLDQETKKLGWGSGFLSYKKCEWIPLDSGEVDEHCEDVTPGRTIADSLNKSLGAGQDSLIQADEINEIIGALLGQLVQQVMGPDGLLGASRSSNGQPSYMDRMVESESNTDSIVTRALQSINRNIQSETNYLDIKQGSMDAVNNIEAKLNTLINCYTAKIIKIQDNSTTNLLWNSMGQSLNETTAQSRIGSASTTIRTKITPLKNTLLPQIISAENNLSVLNSAKIDIETAESVSDLSIAIDAYETIEINGGVHTTKDIVNAEIERDGLVGNKGVVVEMEGLETLINTDISTCESFIYTNDPNN